MAKRKARGRSGRAQKPVRRASDRKPKSRKKPANPARRRPIAKAKSLKKKPLKASRKARRKPAGARRAAVKTVPRQPAKPKALTARRPSKPTNSARAAVQHVSRVNRERRILDESVPSLPSSLDLDRRGSAVRTGRAEMAEAKQNLGEIGTLTGGDVDADAESAYFSGDEAPGGDNPTPDQDIVDDIGQAMGLAYQDNEELRSGDKVADRDRHRWELDPASSEDYKDRK